MFSWFKKKTKTAAQNTSVFPYFKTPENLSAEEALTLKRELEAQIQKLSQLVAPTPEELQSLHSARQQLSQLLGYDLDNLSALQPSDHPENPQHPDPGQGYVLLIEDDPGLGKLLRFLFEHHHYRVIQAFNGKEALERLQKPPIPDLVTLDLLMPYVDGLEILQTLRKTPGWEKVPVIMLTSKHDEASVARMLKAGADDFLSKPFQPDELLARAERLLKRKPVSRT